MKTFHGLQPLRDLCRPRHKVGGFPIRNLSVLTKPSDNVSSLGQRGNTRAQLHDALRPQRINATQGRRHASTTSYQHITVAKHELKDNRGHYVRLELANPKKLNLVGTEAFHELSSAIKSLHNDENLRVLVLAGAHEQGKTPAFCGGANIHEMSKVSSSEEARKFIMNIYQVCEDLRRLPATAIAAIDGLCLGAGLEIVAACDFRLATKRSLFAMPEVAIGIPSVVHARSLVNVMGWQKAKRLMMYANQLNGEEALASGLVDEVFETAEDLEAAVQRDIGVLSVNGRTAMHAQKKLHSDWEEQSFSDGLQTSIDAFAHAYSDGGQEPRGLMNAWIEKQKQRKKK